MLKVTKVEEDSGANKIMIQLINVSDKILYNEVNAEKSFLTLINAAISHELRNPLNQIVAFNMINLLLCSQLIQLLNEQKDIKQLKKKAGKIVKQLHT